MVDEWYSTNPIHCPEIDGIFFDEGPACYMLIPPVDCPPNVLSDSEKSWYHELYQQVASEPGQHLVMLNVGGTEDVNDWVMDQATDRKVCDIALLVEDWANDHEVVDPNTGIRRIALGYLNANYHLQPWAQPPERVAHTIHDCPAINMGDVIKKSAAVGAGYVWVVEGDSNPGGGYSRLPPYWSDEVEAIRPPHAFVQGPPGVVGGPTVSFNLYSDKADSTFQYQLDGGGWLPSELYLTVTVAPGDHQVDVVALDAAGHQSLTPATSYWIYDPQPPVNVIIDSGPATSVTDTTAVFVFHVDRSADAIECELDGAGWSGDCNSPVTYTGLAVGGHVFAVRGVGTNNEIGPATTWAWSIIPTGGERLNPDIYGLGGVGIPSWSKPPIRAGRST